MRLRHKCIIADINDQNHEWSGTGWYSQMWKVKNMLQKMKVSEENLSHYAVSCLTKIPV